MITFVGGTEEGMEAVEEILRFFAGDIDVTLALSDRTLTILYWQAVNHRRDATEAFGDIEDGEVEQLFELAITDLTEGGFYQTSRTMAAEGMGELLRKYLIAGIDDEDLIDTYQMRRDVQGAPILVES